MHVADCSSQSYFWSDQLKWGGQVHALHCSSLKSYRLDTGLIPRSTNKLNNKPHNRLKDNIISKIWSLIYTADIDNITLALQLAKSRDIDLDLKGYEKLYTWLISHNQNIGDHWIENQTSNTIEKKLQIIFEITELTIEPENLDEIPTLLGELKQLEELSIKRNRLNKIPNLIFSLPNLISLSIDQNSICEIPSTIAKLKKLKYLSLKGNFIEIIPKSIFSLLDLGYLNLSSNKISFIPENIIKLTHLEYLILNSNDIHNLPDLLFTLKSLKYFIIDFYKIPKKQLLKLKVLLPQVRYN